MKICAECGNKINEGSNFCFSCGSKVKKNGFFGRLFHKRQNGTPITISSLIRKPKPSLSPIAKVLKGMELFSDCAFVLVTSSDYETSPRKTMAVFAYLLGACDALGQMHRITHDETIQCFRFFLESRFPSMNPTKREHILSYLIDAKNAKVLASFVQSGGQSIVEWSRGNSNAPLGLAEMLMSL
jgi:hypothetical protein